MDRLLDYTNRVAMENYLYSMTTPNFGSSPDIAEPITKPVPTTIPRPAHDDPFNVPAPAIDPTPKGFSFF